MRTNAITNKLLRFIFICCPFRCLNSASQPVGHAAADAKIGSVFKNIVFQLALYHNPYHYISEVEERKHHEKRAPEHQLFVPVQAIFEHLAVIEGTQTVNKDRERITYHEVQ